MKKFLLIVGLFLVSITAQSQILITLLLGDKLNSDGVEFGLETGFNYSTISGLESNSYYNDLFLGFYFYLRIKNQWHVNTGVLVKSNFGTDKLTSDDLFLLQAEEYSEEGNYEQSMSAFTIPALIKYKFKRHFYIELGPQLALITKAKIEYTSTIEDKDITIIEDNSDHVNSIDAGVSGGLGYQLMKGKGVTIGARYYYGFVDLYKDIPNSYNSSFYIKVNIPIGAKAKEKAKAEAEAEE